MRQAVIDDIAYIGNQYIFTTIRAAQSQHIFHSFFFYLLLHFTEQSPGETAGLVFPVGNYFVVVSNIVDDIFIFLCTFH